MSLSLVYLVLQVFHHMVLIFHSIKGRFSDLEDFWARRLPDDFREVFRQSLLPCLPFIIDLNVLISFLVCFSSFDLGLIYMFFRSGSDSGRPMGSLLGSLLRYNALEDF
ncbi:unnamed protein product [Brassica rapa]|uniref:Uncharacterized protein n=1 Tax=Brassica campestris TaxID=3711 RepID=A0A8D9HM90_BRACM|nr:unnamed protein product [Brassica rapa]